MTARIIETPEAHNIVPVAPKSSGKDRFQITVDPSGAMWRFHDPSGRWDDRLLMTRGFARVHARAAAAYEAGDEDEAARLFERTGYEAQQRLLARGIFE